MVEPLRIVWVLARFTLTLRVAMQMVLGRKDGDLAGGGWPDALARR